jgi:hypothetical protein
MESMFQQAVEATAAEGPRRFAHWDAALFDELSHGPVIALSKTLASQSQAAKVFTAYLRLLQEAIGAGYLYRTSSERAPNFLAFCLVRWIPEALGQVPPADQLPLLVKVWNLGEGLLREPAWVDRYVLASAAGPLPLQEIEAFLVRVLEPALAPAAPARWGGPFTVAVLDPRPLHEEFLPGEMHLAAPAVVCVHDRRHPAVHLGVFLRPDRRSRFMGLTPCLGEYPAESGLPAVRLEERRLVVGGQNVDLPFLRFGHRHLLARAGFSVASAVDSQRLWIVETP